MHILVVEDDLVIRELLSKMIGPGHDVVLTSSYEEVAKRDDLSTFDVAAVDLTLDHDTDGGLKTAAMLRQAGTRRIVIITGRAGHEMDRIRPQLLLVSDAIVVKPFALPELLRALGVVTEAQHVS